jgi:hypothetical protein
VRAPERPFVEEPDTKFKDPLTPSAPALLVLMLKVPLDVAVPKPEIIEIAPPVFSAE